MQEYFFENPFFADFYLVTIGHQKCPASHRFGPSIRGNYILHFIVKGHGSFYVEGVKHELQQGDFFLLRPSVETYYEASATDPWEYYWLGFDGEKTNDILNYLKITPENHVGKAENATLITQRFESILRPAILADSNQLLIQQYLYEILGAFHTQTTSRELLEEEKRRYSYSFIQYVHHYYQNPALTIADIAKNFGLNHSYFSQVIKSEMGMTPNDYLSFFRMKESCRLLVRTNKSVKEIAVVVGYENPLTFSRAFKNIHGVSPLAYRVKNQTAVKTKDLKNSDIKQ